MKTIRCDQLYELMQENKNLVLIDVRNPDEFEKMHIPTAKLQPLPQFTPESLMKELSEKGLENNEIYVTCASGKRAEMACHLLYSENYPNVTLLEGGTMAWYQAGLPIEGELKTA